MRALLVLVVSSVLGACGARQAEEAPLPVDDPVEEEAPPPPVEEEGPLPPVVTGVVEGEEGYEVEDPEEPPMEE